MPPTVDPTMQALRLAYNAAVTAHSDRSKAVTTAILRGEDPSPDLVEAEAKARAALTEARAKLHAAMARAIAGN